MGKSFFFKRLCVIAALPLFSLCSLFSAAEDEPVSEGGTGSGTVGQTVSGFRLDFDGTAVAETLGEEVDVGGFVLEITDSDGKTLYIGSFCDAPETFELPAGKYTVRAVSSEFRTPAFSSPQYGDERRVSVTSGKVIGVTLGCRLMNCGVRLKVSSDFLTQYPKSSLFVRSADGRLLYSYMERRTAYFRPGKVSVLLLDEMGSKTLVTRSLSSGEVVALKVDGSGASSEGDGSGSGGLDGGDVAAGAMSVAEALECAGETDVWVEGYVAGGDLTSSKASFVPPFKSRSNILLGPRSSVTSRENCLSVQLPEGDARDGLNLVDNPQMLGRQVLLCGDIVDSYYGMVGIKNISDFAVR